MRALGERTMMEGWLTEKDDDGKIDGKRSYTRSLSGLMVS